MTRRRRWADLGGAERVGLYTRQSLYLVLWAFVLYLLGRAALDIEDGGRAAAVVGGGLAVTAAAFAVQVPVLRRFPATRPLPWRRIVALAVLCVAYAAVARFAWEGPARGAATVVVVGSVTFALGALPGRRIALALLALGALLFGAGTGEVTFAGLGALVVLAMLFTIRASLWVLRVVTDLDDARRAQAQLAVLEERLRFSRDVHDVLGRRLSAIAVQAELAASLAERGDERAAGCALEVRETAHEALREARELARGYRPTDFPQELEGARSLLHSAGIDVRTDVDAMPRAWQEAAGWVVREGVTNVLRHSRATVVQIGYADGRLSVANDGVAADASAAGGSGLAGLRERLLPIGATLGAGPAAPDRWVVEAALPGTGPLSATGATGGGR